MKLIVVLLLNIVSIVSPHSYRNQFKNICGQHKKSLSRIVGGEDAAVGEFPWFARIGLRSRFFCGGTLITDQHVLTAEHCLVRVDEYKLLHDLVVSLGDHNAKSSGACANKMCSDHSVIYKVSRMITYDLNDTSLENDISILKLADKVKFTRWIIPICLADDRSSPATLIGQPVETIGFGLISSHSRKEAEILQKITITIRPIEECSIFPTRPGIGQICAGSSNKDSCDGDSGGPLLKSTVKNGKRQYTQLGIVSYGTAICAYGMPAVYTDVNYFINWIDENLD